MWQMWQLRQREWDALEIMTTLATPVGRAKPEPWVWRRLALGTEDGVTVEAWHGMASLSLGKKLSKCQL